MLTKEFTLTELSSTAAFKTFVSDVGGNPNGVVACLKGYGSGMEANQKEYIEAALNALAPVDVLVFDGDWLKEGSFTAVVPAFLAAKPNARGIAFRKPTAAGHKFFETWEVPEVKDIDKYSYPLGAGLLTLMPLVGSPPTVEQAGPKRRRPSAAPSGFSATQMPETPRRRP